MTIELSGALKKNLDSKGNADNSCPNKKRSSSNGGGKKTTLEVVPLPLGSLFAHPKYAEIYGEDDSVVDIVETIDKDNVEPLKVVEIPETPDKYRIVAGHRRFFAAKEKGFQTLPCIILSSMSEEEELLEFLKGNQYRQKTNLQRVREAMLWWDHEESLSKARQGTRTDLAVADGNIMENRPGSSKAEYGTTTDKVAARVGFGSGKTLQKAKDVLTQINALKLNAEIENNELKALGLAKLLDNSCDSAFTASKWLTDQTKDKKRTVCLQLLELIGADKAANFNEAYAMYLNMLFQNVPADLPKAGQRYVLDCGDIIERGKQSCDHIASFKRRVVATDIPYINHPYGDADGDTWAPATHKVAQFAVEHLRDGESLFVMVGQLYVLDVGAILKSYPDLSYYWIYTVHMPGASRKLATRLVSIQTKSILHFVKGKAADGQGSLVEGRMICDLIESMPIAKEDRLHEWQQPEQPFIPILEHFTFKGDLIIDPMMGVATTGVVALKQQKCFLGFDIDPKAVELAKDRLNKLAGELEATASKPGKDDSHAGRKEGAACNNNASAI